jgi:hypothetical protein
MPLEPPGGNMVVEEVVAMLDHDTMVTPDEGLRQRALGRLKKKTDFHAHLLVYVLVNAFTVGIWFVTGRGLFWPVFLMAAWGIGLVMNAWEVYRRQDYTEEQIQHEISRLR